MTGLGESPSKLVRLSPTVWPRPWLDGRCAPHVTRGYWTCAAITRPHRRRIRRTRNRVSGGSGAPSGSGFRHA